MPTLESNQTDTTTCALCDARYRYTNAEWMTGRKCCPDCGYRGERVPITSLRLPPSFIDSLMTGGSCDVFTLYAAYRRAQGGTSYMSLTTFLGRLADAGYLTDPYRCVVVDLSLKETP